MLVHTLFVSGLRLVFCLLHTFSPIPPLVLPKINYIKILSHQPASFGNLFFHIIRRLPQNSIFFVGLRVGIRAKPQRSCKVSFESISSFAEFHFGPREFWWVSLSFEINLSRKVGECYHDHWAAGYYFGLTLFMWLLFWGFDLWASSLIKVFRAWLNLGFYGLTGKSLRWD